MGGPRPNSRRVLIDLRQVASRMLLEKNTGGSLSLDGEDTALEIDLIRQGPEAEESELGKERAQRR